MTVALFVGDTSLDTTVRVDHLPVADEKVFATELTDSIGGVVTNAAIACLRTGAATRLVSCIGTDPAGVECLAQGQRLGIDFRPEIQQGPANRAIITVAQDGEKRLVLVPGSGMYPSTTTCEQIPLDDVAWVHTAAYEREAAGALVARCAEAGVPWSIDLEPATFGAGIESLAEHINGAAVVFCNARASRAIGPHSAEVLRDMGARAVVLTEGSRGARWHTAEDTYTAPVPSDASVVDTTGAGDCLAGSFIGLFAETGDPRAALHYAVRAASRSCAMFGGHRSYVTRRELSCAP